MGVLGVHVERYTREAPRAMNGADPPNHRPRTDATQAHTCMGSHNRAGAHRWPDKGHVRTDDCAPSQWHRD